MLKLKTTKKFRLDYKRCKKRGYNMKKLEYVINQLLDNKILSSKYKDHTLTGTYKGFHECHIRPDWLLIYIINESELILTASRTGTHADLLNI